MSAGGPSWVLLLERHKGSARLSRFDPSTGEAPLATLANLVRAWSEDLFV